MDPSMCGAENIDRRRPDTSALPENCLPTVGAYYFGDLINAGELVAISCPFVAMMRYLFESLSFLSDNIKSRDKLRWARFELGVSFLYTLIVQAWVIAWIYGFSSTAAAITQLYMRVTERAAIDAATYGADFPLAYSRVLSTHIDAALNLFYALPGSMVAMGLVLSLIQIFGLVFAACVREEETSVAGLRAVISLKLFVLCAVVPFGSYLAFFNVNAALNV